MIGHEYGWTPDYVLDHLSRAEVEALLAAIGRRYERQAAAMDESTSGARPRREPGEIDLSGDLTEQALARELGKL